MKYAELSTNDHAHIFCNYLESLRLEDFLSITDASKKGYNISDSDLALRAHNDLLACIRAAIETMHSGDRFSIEAEIRRRVTGEE